MNERPLLADACKRIVLPETWQAWCDATDPENAEETPLPGASSAELVRHQYHIRQTVLALAEAADALNRDLRGVFTAGGWLAWGFRFCRTDPLRQNPSLSLIGASEWGRFDVINVPGSRLESKHSGAGYEGICCAPLLSRANASNAEAVLAGISLSGAVERFILADPEVQNLYRPSRRMQGMEGFADAFTKAITAGVTLPLSDKPTIASALLPIITPLVNGNAEALADVLARRFDALAFYLDKLHVAWGNDPDVPAGKLDADFVRATTRLNLSDFSLADAGAGEAITNLRFAPPSKANAPSASDSKSKGGRPRIYDKHLAALEVEVVADPQKAKRLTTKTAIYCAVEKRISGGDSAAGTKGGKGAEKAFAGNPLAHSIMERIISVAKNLS